MTDEKESGTNKLKAATLVLEITGHRKKESSQIREGTLGSDQISELKSRVREYKEIETIEDATFKEEENAKDE